MPDYRKGEDGVWRDETLLMSPQDCLLHHQHQWYIARRAPEDA